MTHTRKTKTAPTSPVRCAIYTRKSTEEGLDQDFNSLDAQREAAKAYIHSQAHAGWTALSGRYDDGGYSGSNLDRPALPSVRRHPPNPPSRPVRGVSPVWTRDMPVRRPGFRKAWHPG